MTNAKKSVFQIFMEGLGIYVKHLPIFLKYMSFPVLGQILGIILSFVLSLGFAYNFSGLIQDEKVCFAVTLLLALPGIIVFTKAFWEYLVAYVSVCSMAENTVKSGRIYDINAHKKIATMSKRVGDFISLWLLFGLFTIVAILPPMWIFAAVIFVFICLIFQVFTFERNLSPVECFKRSAKLVVKNFGGTVGLLLILGIGTYFLLPKIAEFILGLIQIVKFSTMILDPLVAQVLPIDNWNAAFAALEQNYIITSLDVSKMIISSVISWLIVSYTLPLRSICFTLWYKQLCINDIKSKTKSKKAKAEDV